jgi:hypothetical protein
MPWMSKHRISGRSDQQQDQKPCKKTVKFHQSHLPSIRCTPSQHGEIKPYFRIYPISYPNLNQFSSDDRRIRVNSTQQNISNITTKADSIDLQFNSRLQNLRFRQIQIRNEKSSFLF